MTKSPKPTTIVLIIFAALVTLTACMANSQTSASPTVQPKEIVLVTETAVIPPTKTPFPTRTEMSTPASTIIPTQTAQPTAAPTSLPTATATAATVPVSFPESTPVYAGTQLYDTNAAIGANNFQQLTHVAQWGYGTIFGAAFAPDGQQFVVGSATGFLVYDMKNLDSQPRWVPLAAPFYYESISFSQDGNYLLMEDRDTSQMYRFSDGYLVTDIENVIWQTSSKRTPYNDRQVISPDKKLRFESYSTAEEDQMNIEIVVEELSDNDTGEILFQFPESTLYVEFGDYHEAEGCDLYTFSMCGNVFDPSAMQPYRVAFAPTSDTIAVMYRAMNLWDRSDFSLLRIYSTTDGKMLAKVGSFNHPVVTFAYTPNGKSLLVGYGDGVIELWRIGQNSPVFDAHHFDAPIVDLAYSHDGQFVVVQRPDSVEVRQTDTGAITQRFEANTFALSPTKNMLALGGKNGTLTLQDIEKEETHYYFTAHAAELFALAFSPDGRTLTSSGGDCRVQSWDTATATYLHDFAENSTDAYDMDTESRIFIKHMAYIPDTDQLLGYGSWSRVVNWQAETGETRYLIEPEPLEYYNGMKTLNPHFPKFFGFNPANQSFLIDSVEYDANTGERLGEYQPPEELPAGCAAVGPTTTDGTLMLTQGYDEHAGEICILDAENLWLVQTMPLNASMDPVNDPIAWLYLSPGGEQLLVSSYSGVIHVYQLTDPRMNASKNIRPERLKALYPW